MAGTFCLIVGLAIKLIKRSLVLVDNGETSEKELA